jgi:hypothetical protein
MSHKSYLFAAVCAFFASFAVPAGIGAPLVVAAFLLLLTAGITRPVSRLDEYSLTDTDLSLSDIDGAESESGLSERERMNRLIDRLSLRSVRTIERPEQLVM